MNLPSGWRAEQRRRWQAAMLPSSWEIGSPHTLAGLRLLDDTGAVQCVVAVLMWN